MTSEEAVSKSHVGLQRAFLPKILTMASILRKAVFLAVVSTGCSALKMYTVTSNYQYGTHLFQHGNGGVDVEKGEEQRKKERKNFTRGFAVSVAITISGGIHWVLEETGCVDKWRVDKSNIRGSLMVPGFGVLGIILFLGLLCRVRSDRKKYRVGWEADSDFFGC